MSLINLVIWVLCLAFLVYNVLRLASCETYEIFWDQKVEKFRIFKKTCFGFVKRPVLISGTVAFFDDSSAAEKHVNKIKTIKLN